MNTDQFSRYQRQRRVHWDKVASRMIKRSSWSAYYHQRLTQIYQYLVPPGKNVIELGCGCGDLLAALKPALGMGIDFSERMLKIAAERHPHLNFVQCDIYDLCLETEFDFFILSDLLNDLWDVQRVLEQIHLHSSSKTRIIINNYSRLWELPIKLSQRLGAATPLLPQNWLTVEDISGLLNLADFDIISHWPEILWPLKTPIVSMFLNRYMAKIWPFRYFTLTNFIIARCRLESPLRKRKPLVSVVVPARNEAGNIPHIIKRVPEMGRGTEIVFVEGNSSDDTYSVIEKEIKRHPERRCKLLKQSGVGKGDAVRLGFKNASGDMLMILDADMTVPPEYLPRFYEAIQSGRGDFANGVRLVYPMEKQAMRYLNLVGNKFFSLAFSWLLGQPIKDTLCGTKVLLKDDYESVAANRSYFGDFDPFGDFDLLFGAAKLNFKIVDIPIRYHERYYGSTNIDRWRHGWLLLRMVLFAASRIKFI